MMTYLINYAHRTHTNAQKRNSKTGLEVAGFDQVIEFGYQHLDPSFRAKNHAILSQARGAGYWLWKPYIIWLTLANLPLDSIVFYCDSGAEFIGSARESIDLLQSIDQPILCYEHAGYHYEEKWTKGDTFSLMGYTPQKRIQMSASYIMIRNNDTARQFAVEWLSYCEDARILTDLPSQYPNDSSFVDHRHDQAVYSILCHQYNFDSFRDPSQWGAKLHETPKEILLRSTYTTWICNERKRD